MNIFKPMYHQNPEDYIEGWYRKKGMLINKDAKDE